MISFFVFVLGLAVGSFLNSVIWRMERGENPLKGRSYCPHCEHSLSWHDLIPVLSFLTLRGKCRYCKKNISLQYPFVELATATLFVLIFSYLSLGIVSDFGFRASDFAQLLYLWVISSLLVVIFVYDLKYFIIPDQIVYSGIVIAFLYSVWNFGHGNLFRISDFGFGILPTLFFLFLFLISQGKWMGFGDIKLALLMGLFLGWPNILVALFLAFFLGALVGIFLVVSRKKGWKSQVPFGPFLITGTFLALFFGDTMVAWYLDLVLV